MADKIAQSYAILQFYKSLKPDFTLPGGVAVMNPFQDQQAWNIVTQFYQRFYNDACRRVLIFGINPGRFGGGVTGVPFTDPIRLESKCGIENTLQKKPELSSDFIYRMIDAYGGTSAFYANFFITALSPLGYTRNNLNLNYYDDRQLMKNCEPFIVRCIEQQLKSLKTTSERCFCLGEGTNYRVFQKLNEKYRFFNEIISLPHPRWIMQYRRKKMDFYINLYVEKLSSISHKEV